MLDQNRVFCNLSTFSCIHSLAPTSHYDALLVVLLPVGLLDLVVSVAWWSDFHRCPAADGGSDGCQALLCALVPRVGSLDVPDVGFEDVAAAADAHFCEVADCVLSFDVACIQVSGLDIFLYLGKQ